MYRAIYLTLWLILVAYWISAAWGNKPTVYRVNPTWRILFIAACVALIVLFRAYPGYFGHRIVSFSDERCWIGIGICAAGVAFAIWARRTLGRNWSGNPTIKEGHELIETGPYRFVRHPIYTGILVASVGTAVGVTRVRELVLLVFVAVSLWLKLKIEESLMTRQFPQTYPEYKRRTKALIPYIL